MIFIDQGQSQMQFKQQSCLGKAQFGSISLFSDKMKIVADSKLKLVKF